MDWVQHGERDNANSHEK